MRGFRAPLGALLVILTSFNAWADGSGLVTRVQVRMAEPRADDGGREMIEIGPRALTRTLDFEVRRPQQVPDARAGALPLALDWRSLNPPEAARALPDGTSGSMPALSAANRFRITPPDIKLPWLSGGNAASSVGNAIVDNRLLHAALVGNFSGTTIQAKVGDALMYLVVAMPVVVDSGLVAMQGDSDLAFQMLAIDGQSLSVTATAAVFGGALSHGSSPFDGQTSMAFTGAGLTCAHHGANRIFERMGGGSIADYATCFAAIAASATVAGLRVSGGEADWSQAMIGAGVGLVSGYLLPSIFSYGFGKQRDLERTSSRWAVSPMVTPQFAGVAASGSW